MEQRVEAIFRGDAGHALWLLEHPPLYTAGTSARPDDLLTPDRFPVYRTGRGGQYTYHGPGQRVAYVMRDLRRDGRDVRAHVCRLEQWMIDTLAAFGLAGERRDGRIGIWLIGHDPLTGAAVERKIAAVGVRVRRWVAYHGIALNVAPDLSHFAGIVPCGIRQHGVTSLKDQGLEATMAEVDQVLLKHFTPIFGGPIHETDLPASAPDGDRPLLSARS